MTILTQNTVGSLILQLQATDGSPATGLLFSDVTADLLKEGGVFAPFTLTALNWTEIGSGTYQVSLATTDTDVLGNLYLRIAGGAIRSYLADAVVAVSIPTSPTTTPVIPTVPLFGFLKDPGSAPVVGASISYRILSTPAIYDNGSDNVLLSDTLVTTKTDLNGFFTFDAIIGAVIDVFIPVANYRRQVTVPSTSTSLFDLT